MRHDNIHPVFRGLVNSLMPEEPQHKGTTIVDLEELVARRVPRLQVVGGRDATAHAGEGHNDK